MQGKRFRQCQRNDLTMRSFTKKGSLDRFAAVTDPVRQANICNLIEWAQQTFSMLRTEQRRPASINNMPKSSCNLPEHFSGDRTPSANARDRAVFAP
jgi:hypothetical protein